MFGIHNPEVSVFPSLLKGVIQYLIPHVFSTVSTYSSGESTPNLSSRQWSKVNLSQENGAGVGEGVMSSETADCDSGAGTQLE